MSLSIEIQNTQDSELIRLFLQFVQKYNLHYQKTTSQISYKCYEATWKIQQLMIKSTGYGRTQSQAYKHALRNLYDILIEDEQYQNYFLRIFNLKHQQQFNQNIKDNQPNKYKQNDQLKNANLNLNKSSKSKSKIILNKSISNDQNYVKNNKQKLAEAKKRYSQLLVKLNDILQQNNVLRSKIHQQQSIKTIATININSSERENQSPEKIEKKLNLKINIPKLKLNILPNYHKKSEKSLNQSLLAAYNQKHKITYADH